MTQRKPKEAMKEEIQTPVSSVKSSITLSSNPSETRDTFYFPGCRKDANCKCEICIASINATLDLMPQSTRRSSLTKFSSSRPMISRSPVSFNPLLTPKSRDRIRTVTAPLSSIEKLGFEDIRDKRKVYLGFRVYVAGIIWGLIFTLGIMGYEISGMVFEAKLCPKAVRNLGERSRDFGSSNERIQFLENELKLLVRKEVSSCSSVDSLWKISEAGLLLNTRCVLYKSMAEEVSIWGWPLQAAGLVEAEYSPRSLTIISGQIAEWSNGEAKFQVRDNRSNSSWILGKWATSVVRLEPNTWILEYRMSIPADNARLLSAAVEFLKFKLIRGLKRMLRSEFWLPAAFDRTSWSIPIPT